MTDKPMTKEERIILAYEVYEEQLKVIDEQAATARLFARESLNSVLATIRRHYQEDVMYSKEQSKSDALLAKPWRAKEKDDIKNGH